MIHSFKQCLISMLLTAQWKVLIEESGFIQSWTPQVESSTVQSPSGWSHQSANAWFNIACVNAGTRADGHSFGYLSSHLLLILSCAESTRSRPHAELDTHKRPCLYRLTKRNTQASTISLVGMDACTHTHTHKLSLMFVKNGGSRDWWDCNLQHWPKAPDMNLYG